ncbi:unnamed protein product [Fraxinus pennsylvanica]|uniref:Polygalacturonase n=1 Tax=Fraxinus pennsylvanica TaxID=56036 RepID=A0AAD2AAY1_9LAMI|nr:unnamed protein product [Fraxinus pennsylvanica]
MISSARAASMQTVNVDDFGAKADGRTDDSQAFKKAWSKACSSSQQSLILIPNKTYYINPINFTGPCKSALKMEIRGTIEAFPNMSLYEKSRRRWIFFEKVRNFEVYGGGTINGNGQGGRGYAKNIVFENVMMQNVTNPIIIDQNYCDQDKPCQHQKSAVQVKNVVYKNIRGTSASENSVGAASIQTVNVDDFGAKADGRSDDSGTSSVKMSNAFKKAWREACNFSQQSLVLIPNKTYHMKPTSFSGPCKSALKLGGHRQRLVCDSSEVLYWGNFPAVLLLSGNSFLAWLLV